MTIKAHILSVAAVSLLSCAAAQAQDNVFKLGAIRYTTSKKKQRGAEYVILGPVTSALSLATDYDHRYVGYTQFDRLGYGAAGGDVDGDGEIDLVMGANGYDGYGVTDTGATYVFLGPISASSA